MKRLIYRAAAVLSFTALFLGCSLGITAQTTLEAQQWQVRARTTADDTKQARLVILDAIYAGQTVVVADAYEAALKEKPADQVRIANFAWAAMVAERYSPERQSPELDRLAGRAVHVVEPIVCHTSVAGTVKEQQEYLAFRPTKEPLAWLVWGHYLARFCFDKGEADKAYKHALALDPNLAEAYFDAARMVVSPYDAAYFKTHRDLALAQLDKSERLQPKLHPLVVGSRADIAMASKQYKTAAKGMREYLALWPGTPLANETRKLIVELEAAGGQ